MRFREFSKLSLALILVSSSVSCVLKKRDQPKKDDPAKTSSSPTDPNAGPLPMKNGPITTVPGHVDQQGQMDLETFYRPTDLESIEREEQTRDLPQRKNLTGHKLDLKEGNPLDVAYTDASTDLLTHKLRSLKRDSSHSNEQIQRSFDFAKDIKSVKILDSRGTIFTVLIQYETGVYKVFNPNTGTQEPKRDKTTLHTKRISGASHNDGRYANLSETQSNTNSVSTTTTPDDSKMKGELRCLDQSFKQNKCGNYLLQVTKTNSDGIEAQADIVIRVGTAKISEIKVNNNPDHALSEKSTKLLDLFNKTYEDHYFEEKLAKIYSIAVVEGISEFKVELVTNKNELITVGGPLITGIGNAVPIKYPLSKNPDFKIFKESNKVTTDITTLFDVALLNYNNGRGKIKVTFENTINTSSDDPSKQEMEEVTVTLINETSPTVKLSKETIYFNPEQ